MPDLVLLDCVADAICADLKLTRVNRVGSGAFKATYHVRNENGAHKALKVFNDKNRKARIQRELNALKRCRHSSIAQFDMMATHRFDGKDYHFCIEEYIAGGTLECRIDRALLTHREIYPFGKQLIGAIQHISELDLVHRDIKPANIVLREDSGAPVLIDFGLVRHLGASSLTETWIPQGPGTPLFAPPEQLNNDKDLIDWRADQFSLGIVFVKSLCGRHPYEDDEPDTFQAVDNVSSRSNFSPWFMAWTQEHPLHSLIAKMVQPWPVQRFRASSTLMKAWADLEGSV